VPKIASCKRGGETIEIIFSVDLCTFKQFRKYYLLLPVLNPTKREALRENGRQGRKGQKNREVRKRRNQRHFSF
jgi:hypothetical protein